MSRFNANSALVFSADDATKVGCKDKELEQRVVDAEKFSSQKR